MNSSAIKPVLWRRRLLSLFSAHERTTKNSSAAGSVVALDWNDSHAVLGWFQAPSQVFDPNLIEVQTHAIPEGLMLGGQWQDERAWVACLETWVEATKVSQPLMVVALPAQDLSHHWLVASVDGRIDSTYTLESLVDQTVAEHALTEQAALSSRDQVFDVLPESDLWSDHESSLVDGHISPKNQRWCLLGASKAKVSSHDDLFASSHLRLACIDSRPRALLGYWQHQLSNKGPHCMLDDHLSTIQWWVTSQSGEIEMGHFSHQRLSLAERVDHLTQRLATSQASHGFDALHLSNDQHGEAAEVAGQVAQRLGIELVCISAINRHGESASQQAVVHGLLASQMEKGKRHVF